jgi:geranylgeranyl diphosphate synthase type II
MGKNAGSDVHKHKSTYPQLLTLDGARQKLDDHFRRAKQHLAASGIDDRLLFQIADYVANRNT